MQNNKPVIITPGEPAGVGPDLVIALAQREWPIQLVVCADPEMMLSRARQLDLPLQLQTYSPEHTSLSQAAGTLTILPVYLQSPTIVGEL
ncbi:4-hydroxythreonine-4-phosphate dehydrogenase, partial [Xenorhabdus bovienii]|nr:4-hydroxythreonine-4-phosphate dehydrogenase [Xenorhabdus bovienii]